MVVIAGRFRYATKLYVDYLSVRMPGVLVATKIPTDAIRDGRPLVVIDSVSAGGYPNLVLATRRLVFSCYDEDELSAGELCEWVRAEVRASRYAYICRRAEVVGEPARFDRPDEPVPRFQTTIDVLLRESYGRTTEVIPPGPPVAPPPEGAVWWFVGEGPPGPIEGTKPGDYFFDTAGGVLYRWED